MSRLRDLNEIVLPAIAASGRVGDNVRFVECLLDGQVIGEAQFASSVCFVVAVFKDSNETLFQRPLVVKYTIDNAAVRKWLKLDYQFRNEVVFYEKVIPCFDRNEKVDQIFPKYFYGSAKESEDPSRYVLVLEDLRSTGFRLSSEWLHLDFDHCALTFKKLGEFHGLSFVAKQLHPEVFHHTANELIETRLFDDNKEDAQVLYGLSFQRASESLLSGKYKNEIVSLRNRLNIDAQDYMKNLLTFEEPMAVICHGDFCRNNVLYKYDKDGLPEDVKFFDLATARYASPMIDFSFFFFLNSSEESRKKNREKYLEIYYEALSSSVPSEVSIPTLEDFKHEFLLKAVYGFLICAFFKPAMMDPVPFNPEVDVNLPKEVHAAKIMQNGGQEGTEVIANMLKEILELKVVL